MADIGVTINLYSGATGLSLHLYETGNPINSGGDNLSEVSNGYFEATVSEALSSDYDAVVKSGSNILHEDVLYSGNSIVGREAQAVSQSVSIDTNAIADAVWDEPILGADNVIRTARTTFAYIDSDEIGSGSIEQLITINDGSVPLEGVAVWVSEDVEGSNIIAGTLYTDTLGQTSFMLDSGTYYIWKQLSGYNFTNPEVLLVTGAAVPPTTCIDISLVKPIVSSQVTCNTNDYSFTIKDNSSIAVDGMSFASNAVTFSITDGTNTVERSVDVGSTTDFTSLVSSLLGSVSAWTINQTVSGLVGSTSTIQSGSLDITPCKAPTQILQVMEVGGESQLSCPIDYNIQLANYLNVGIADNSGLLEAVNVIHPSGWVYNSGACHFERPLPVSTGTLVLEEETVVCSSNPVDACCYRSDAIVNDAFVTGSSPGSIGTPFYFTDNVGDLAYCTTPIYSKGVRTNIRISPAVSGAVQDAVVPAFAPDSSWTIEIIGNTVVLPTGNVYGCEGKVEKVRYSIVSITDPSTVVDALNVPDSATVLYENLTGTGPWTGIGLEGRVTVYGPVDDMIGMKFDIEGSGLASDILSIRGSTSLREPVLKRSLDCGETFSYSVIRDASLYAHASGNTACE